MRTLIAIIVAIGVLLFAIVSLQNKSTRTVEEKGSTLMVFCAAGIKKPVAKIAEDYEKEFGVTIQLQYGGTGTLLSQVLVAKRGDIFIAADDGAVESAREREAVKEAVKLAIQYPVIGVKKGNPKNIQSFGDLLREDVRVAIANPEAASIGKRTRKAAGDQWEKLQQHVTVMKPTVTELAADLTVGSIDAAVIWNSTTPQFQELEAIEIPEFNDQKDNVSATILTACDKPQSALKFARYLIAPEKGGKTFTEMGFKAHQGDAWQEKPEMVLYSGGVNRPAVEELLNQFAEREGITLTTVFNGCGILCASMQAMTNSANPKFPDAYYACDLCFVPPVAEHFPESVMLTETEIGICVRKDNPKKIKTLADLAQPGLKVGLCNAEQSTLGFMTQGMLKSSALHDSIRKNVVVEVPTADFLVNQMRAGSLEAAIVYKVNYQLQEEHLEFIPIDHEGAKAVQPFSVRGDSKNRQLAGRLLEHLLNNRQSFEDTGFTWTGDQEAIKSKDIEVPPWLKPHYEKKGSN